MSMKRSILTIIVILTASAALCGGVVFNDYFIDETMRVDYFHIGDSDEELITLDRIYRQGTWAGSLKNLIDTFDNGRYYVKVYDGAGETLIYSRGFDSYFGEYQTTGAAARGVRRSYHETALIPFPKKPVLFTLESRDSKTKPLNQQPTGWVQGRSTWT